MLTSDRGILRQHILPFGEFIEKLVALTLPPRAHLARWDGLFAPNSPFRREITCRPEIIKGSQFREEDADGAFCDPCWSKMPAKAFKIDLTICDYCGGKLKKSMPSTIVTASAGIWTI